MSWNKNKKPQNNEPSLFKDEPKSISLQQGIEQKTECKFEITDEPFEEYIARLIKEGEKL